MAKIFIPQIDEQFTRVLREKGLGVPNAPHWVIARIALARSLQMPQFPDEELKRPLTRERALEIHTEQLTGENNPAQDDYTDQFRLLLSLYHEEDLFVDRDRYIELLQRHVMRGTNEIKASWRENYDFHDYLYQELFFQRPSDELGPAQDITEKLHRALEAIGVNANIEDTKYGPRVTRYTLHLASAGDLDRLHRDLDKIPFEMGMEQLVAVSKAAGERRVALDVPRLERDWEAVDASVIPQTVQNFKEALLPVCPGVDVLGAPFVFDLADCPHLLVAGTTGSGKSICLHAILLSLLSSGRDVRIALVDPKEVEFTAYAGSKHLWNKKVITEVVDAVGLLDDLIEEMDERQKALARLGVANLAEAQKKGSKLPRIVVVIDELADLLMQHPDSETTIVRLVQKARATGIHMVLATQRPDAHTFTGLLRSNVPSRIALTVRTSQESRIILDEMGAEKLLMKGDMLVHIAGKKTVRVHGARIEQGDIRPWM